MSVSGPKVTAERRAVLAQCVADGWPLLEIHRTHGANYRTMRRHFPDYRGMPKPEAAKLGAAAKKANQKMRTR